MKGRFNPIRKLLFLLLMLIPLSARGEENLKEVRVNDIELHYIEAGEGVPVIFIHGSLVDYRRWAPQIEPFSRQYHVIAYSRRYNFPNKNHEMQADYSAMMEAEDLAAMMKVLNLERAHVIGESYGAYTALLLALHDPELVRSLVLAETPVMDWLREIPEGEMPYYRFMKRLWAPSGEALKRKNDLQAIRIIFSYFTGQEATPVPEEVKSVIEANLLEWKALTASKDAFPDIAEDAVRKMDKPVLMMTGENTMPLFKLLDTKMESLLPNVKRVIVPKASHEMWEEFPAECRNLVMSFLAEH